MASKLWTGGTSNWNNAANWSPNGVPVAGDLVTISSGAVTLDITTADLGRFTLSGTGKLVQGGSFTVATTGNVSITTTSFWDISIPIQFDGSAQTFFSNQAVGRVNLVSTGTITCTSDLTISGTLGSGVLVDTSGILDLSGNNLYLINVNTSALTLGNIVNVNNFFYSAFTYGSTLPVIGTFSTRGYQRWNNRIGLNGNTTLIGSVVSLTDVTYAGFSLTVSSGFIPLSPSGIAYPGSITNADQFDQDGPILLPVIGKPATFNYPVDQAPMVEPAEQSEAILLPLGGPATYSAPVDQSPFVEPNETSEAILLTLGKPASFNYAVDQAPGIEPLEQSEALLLTLGPPATRTRPADQNIGSELSEQNESLLLVFGPSATFKNPVDSDAQVSAYPDQDSALLLAFGPSATFNYNVDQPSVFVPDQAPAILTQTNPYFVAASIFVSDSTLTNINNGNLYNQRLVISIDATLPTFTSGTSSISLQNQALLTQFSPSSTWKQNVDQPFVSTYVNQDAAILLPFGAPETSSYPVDQNNSYEPTGEIAPNQSNAILLGLPGVPIATFNYAVDQSFETSSIDQQDAILLLLGEPATANARVDQSAPSLQNQAILLPFGPPATFTTNVDQAAAQLQPQAMLLTFGPSATFNYNVDQTSAFVPDQAPAILTQANPYFVGASLFLNQNKELFRMESTLPFFTSGTTVVSLQNQAMLLPFGSPATFSYNVDRYSPVKNQYTVSQSAAILLPTVQIPSTYSYNVDQSAASLQNQALLLVLGPPQTFNYNVDQGAISQQAKAILLPIGAPSTFNRKADQRATTAQTGSQLLITFSSPASSSYNVDQSAPSIQNQAILLSRVAPASSTYNTDQSIQGITPAAAILLPFVGFTATSTNPVDQAAAQIQNQAILLTLMPPAPVMSLFLNQNKEAISVTVQEVFSGTISVAEAAENLSITAVYGTGAIIAVNQNKEAISITATETFSSTVSINEATEVISITASVVASSGIFLTQNKEAISILSALIPVGSSSVSSLQSQALLLPLGAPATATANVDQNVVAMQNQAVLLPIGKPASSSYSVDQAVIGQQNTAVILTLTAPSTSSTFSSAVPSLQSQAMLLPFGKPATATYNTDQSIKGLQTQAMLLPEVAPATSTSNVDQTVTGQQNKAILLTLVSSASSSYNVDQAVPSLQNQAMLLAFGKPASSTYATDQSTQSQQSRASILYGVKPASSSYSADQSVIGQQNQAALLGVSSIIVASLPLVEKKQIITLTAQETFQISNIGITEQKQRLDVEATTAQPVIRSSDRAVVYYPQQSQAILLTYAAPSSTTASAASYPGIQTRAILLPSAQIASSNYATDQMLRQLQAPAILASMHFIQVKLYDASSYSSVFKSVYTGVKIFTSTVSITDVETRSKTAYRLVQENEWAYSTFGKVWSTFRTIADVEANTSTLSRTQNLIRPLTSTASYTDTFHANNGVLYSVLLTTSENYTATNTAGKLLSRGISDSESYISSPKRTYPVITPTQSGSIIDVEGYTDSIFVSRFLTRPIFDMMNATDNEEETNQFITTVYNPIRGGAADTSRYTDYVTATVTHTIPNFITVKLVTASGYSDSG